MSEVRGQKKTIQSELSRAKYQSISVPIHSTLSPTVSTSL